MENPKTVQAHLYITVKTNPVLAKKCKELIVKRKLNSLMIKLLDDYFKNEPEQKDLFE